MTDGPTNKHLDGTDYNIRCIFIVFLNINEWNNVLAISLKDLGQFPIQSA